MPIPHTKKNAQMAERSTPTHAATPVHFLAPGRNPEVPVVTSFKASILKKHEENSRERYTDFEAQNETLAEDIRERLFFAQCFLSIRASPIVQPNDA